MACVVLTGEVSGLSPPAEAWSRVAQAFNLDPGNFESQVLNRAPLIIRRNLDQAAATTYVQRLNELGAEAVSLDDDPDLVEIDRDGKRLGPIPAKDAERFLRDGDRYRVRGLDAWATWPASRGSTAEPLTLDTFEAEPRHVPTSTAGVVPGTAKPTASRITPQQLANTIPLPPWLTKSTATKPPVTPAPANRAPSVTPSKPVTTPPPDFPQASRQEGLQDLRPNHYRDRQRAPRSSSGQFRRRLWTVVSVGVLVCIGLAGAAWWSAKGGSSSSAPSVASSQPAPPPASQPEQGVAKTATPPIAPGSNSEAVPKAAPTAPIAVKTASPKADMANAVPATTTSVGMANTAITDNAAPGAAITQPASNDESTAPTAASTASASAMVAPSFDCNRASTSVEIAICASPELRELDAKMGAVYTHTMKSIPADDAMNMKQSQVQWIRKRQQECGGDASCIQIMLLDRINRLEFDEASESR